MPCVSTHPEVSSYISFAERVILSGYHCTCGCSAQVSTPAHVPAPTMASCWLQVRKRIKVVAEEHKELVRRMEAGEDVQFPPKRPRGTLFAPPDAPPQLPPPPPAPQVTVTAGPAPPPAPIKPAPGAKARPPSKQQQQQQQQQPPPQPAPAPQPPKRFWKWGTLQAVAKMIGRPAKPLPPPVMPVDEEEDTLSLPEHTLSQEEVHRPYVAPKPGQAKQNWQVGRVTWMRGYQQCKSGVGMQSM